MGAENSPTSSRLGSLVRKIDGSEVVGCVADAVQVALDHSFLGKALGWGRALRIMEI